MVPAQRQVCVLMERQREGQMEDRVESGGVELKSRCSNCTCREGRLYCAAAAVYAEVSVRYCL